MFDSLLVCISGFYNVLSIVFTDSMEIPEQFIDVADGVLGKNKSFLHTYFNIYGCRITFIGRAKRAPHWGVQSRFHVIYIYI